MPLLDRVYEAWSFNAIPRIGKIVAGDGEPYAYLVESIRKFPNQAELRRDDRARPASSGSPTATIPAASRRCIRAGSFDGCLPHEYASAPGSGSSGPAGSWCARAWSRHCPATSLPACRSSAGASRGCSPAAARSPRAQRAAGRRRRPARTLLRQARPVPGDAARRRRQRHRARPRHAAGPAWRPFRRPRRSRRSRARSAGRSASSMRASASRSPPPRSPRCIRPRSLRDGDAEQGRGQGDPAGRAPRASCSDLESYFLAARLQERYIPSSRRLRPVEVTEDAGADHQDRDGPAAGGGRAFRARPRTPATIPASACRRSTGSAPAATCSPWNGSTASRCPTSRRLRAAGHDLEGDRRQRWCSPSCATRCATASSMPTCIRATCSSRPTAPSSPSISALPAGSARRSAASSPKSSTASSPATIAASPRCISRPATCRATHNVAAFAQAIRAIGEPIHGQPAETISMAQAAHAAVRGDRAVRHGRRGRNWCCCRRPWWWSRAWRARSIRPSTCGRPPSRWSATGSPAISGRAACWPTRATAPRRWFRSARQAPDLAARTERLSREIDADGRAWACASTTTTASAIGKAEARHTRSGRVALWVIALTLVWIAWHLV